MELCLLWTLETTFIAVATYFVFHISMLYQLSVSTTKSHTDTRISACYFPRYFRNWRVHERDQRIGHITAWVARRLVGGPVCGLRE
jgi:hypothetical protein